MLSGKTSKWTLAIAVAGLISVGPVLAAHVSHKLAATKHTPSAKLAATVAPKHATVVKHSIKAKTAVKSKKLASHSVKPVAKTTAKHVAAGKSAVHHAPKLDKAAAVTSNM